MKNCIDCKFCKLDTWIGKALTCTNKDAFQQLFTHEGCEIGVEADFGCKAFEEKEVK